VYMCIFSFFFIPFLFSFLFVNVHARLYARIDDISTKSARIHSCAQRCTDIESCCARAQKEGREGEAGTAHVCGERSETSRGEGWRAICGSLETVGTHVAPRA